MTRARRIELDRCVDCAFCDGIEYIERRPRRPPRRRLERWCLHPDAHPDDPRPLIRTIADLCAGTVPRWCPRRGCVELIAGPTKR
jgi:hypothetical protein